MQSMITLSILICRPSVSAEKSGVGDGKFGRCASTYSRCAEHIVRHSSKQLHLASGALSVVQRCRISLSTSHNHTSDSASLSPPNPTQPLSLKHPEIIRHAIYWSFSNTHTTLNNTSRASHVQTKEVRHRAIWH